MKHTQVDTGQQLIAIVQQFLAESGIEHSQRHLSLDFSLQRHLGIDSLGRAELFQRIEKHFAIQLADNLMAEADTLHDIVAAIHAASPAEKMSAEKIHQHLLKKSYIDPSQAKTLVDVLLLYATGDPDRAHVFLQDEHGREEVITYGMLFENSLRIAHQLQKRGLVAGETVAIMQPTNAGFFYTFFGVLLANCIPVPIYPPFRPQQIEAYAKLEAKILQNAAARMLVTFHEAEKLSKLLRAFVPSLKYVLTVNDLLTSDEKAPIYPAKADDFALIQYTSGSTSAPKGVLLTHQNLLTNIRAYGEALGITHKDICVSWTPLYHDMGLIGLWLGSLYFGLPLILMSPLTFLNRPERWLWAIHYHRGTITGGPNFAYELCIRKIDPAMLEGLDLSSWRIAANGAEAIQPKTLERFTEKFAPYGFKSETHFPVYGLAESSVCLTAPPLNRVPLIDKIDRHGFEEEGLATPSSAPHSLEFVACGTPISGQEIRIADQAGKVLPERHIGHIQFRGPSSMQGYYANPKATLAIYHDGWWDTGDVGYLAEGEIYITGRLKDVIIKAGRNLYPAEIEELAARVPQIRKGCVIAFGTIDEERGTEKLIIVAETRDKKPRQPAAISEQVAEKIVSALDVSPDQVILVPPNTIPKTSSGKLQRAACKALYLSGKLTKKRTPIWFQITKIGMGFGFRKLQKSIANAGKFIYTLYVAVIFCLTIIPVYLSSWLMSRRAFAYLCRFWTRFILFFAFCPIRITGKKNLFAHQPMIFTANHVSYMDPFVLIGVLPVDTVFIGKKELLSNFVLRRFMRKLQHLFVDRLDLSKGLEDTQQMAATLQAGYSLLIFPEGTFGYGEGLRPFKLGAFKVAAETDLPICPIALEGPRRILRGEERLIKPGRIKITVSEPILPAGKEWQDITRLKNQVRAQIAKDCGEPSLDLITTGVAEN